MESKLRTAVVFSAVLVLLLASGGVYGQTTATITGIVTDSTGAVVPGVEITVTNVATRQARSVITNEVGRYYATALNPGGYEVLASLPGFNNVLHSGITLTVGTEFVIDFKLVPGQVSETVDVTGEAPIVQTTNASVAELRSRKRPVPSRDSSSSISVIAFAGPSTIRCRNHCSPDSILFSTRQCFCFGGSVTYATARYSRSIIRSAKSR